MTSPWAQDPTFWCGFWRTRGVAETWGLVEADRILRRDGIGWDWFGGFVSCYLIVLWVLVRSRCLDLGAVEIIGDDVPPLQVTPEICRVAFVEPCPRR